MDPVIGIDLGTTNSAAAFLGPDGPQIIPNALGGRLTPSVVGVDESNKVLVGAAARELQVLHPDRCANLFKRYMGTDHKLTAAGREFTPEELSGLVLRALKADAEAFFGHPVARAVITVPAYFNDRQRKATIAAGKIAGWTVERILNEPTAAAIAYGFHDAGADKKLLVFDLGGGTFDVSVVELFEGTLEVKASSGESALGGEDFTRAFAARLLGTVGASYEQAEARTPKRVSRLVQQCERAKCVLSRDESVTVRIPDAKGEFPPDAPEVVVTREQLDSWVGPTLARAELPIRRVLGDAKLTRDQIDEVILVGGATRMPLVIRRVTELLGKEPRRRLNPDEVVALGAAVQAGLVGRAAAVEELVVTDVAPFTLGVAISKQLGGDMRDGYFDPVIDRNTTIPVSRVKRYSTVHPSQTSIIVRVFQGESRRTDDNLALGEFEVRGIPTGPAHQSVDIRFTYDLNGVLEVEATIVATKRKVSHVVARHAQGMSDAQIRAAVAAMEKLKTHPRDEEANRFVLLRAERVFKELPAELRDVLGELLDVFEAAMEKQDAAVIASHREELERFLTLYDPHGDAPNKDEQ
ncbi:Chaperone protein HscC [Gemmata sp. SH-PL17]|uniref:Hsp70 family protein n=1 Tax=Gemmata sp. SH-PL17 TaxID=1630693 RepID=UPI00078E4B74|nr:Hsp70 family protein [Gemmata sp. SH-PL17]AMV23286.1 Chaperone protein HscC [Gemmata sp. SH-PL17]